MRRVRGAVINLIKPGSIKPVKTSWMSPKWRIKMKVVHLRVLEFQGLEKPGAKIKFVFGLEKYNLLS